MLKNLTDAVRNSKLSLSLYGLSLSLYKRSLSLYKLKLSLKFLARDFEDFRVFKVFNVFRRFKEFQIRWVRKSPKPCAVPGYAIVMLLL